MAHPVVIILAGGANSRFWPLEQKSLFSFLGEPLLTRHIRLLQELGCRDFVVVTNPDNTGLIEELLVGVAGIEFNAVEQPNPLGMANALLCTETLLHERYPGRGIYVTQVHDVADAGLHEAMITAAQNGGAYGYLPGHHVDSYFNGGYLILDNKRVSGIIEKPGVGNEPSDVVKLVADYFSDWKDLLGSLSSMARSGGDDIYEKAVTHLCETHRIEAVFYEEPVRTIKYPWQVLDVMDFFFGQDFVEHFIASSQAPDSRKPLISDKAQIAPDASIEGRVYISDGVVVGPGVIIQGPVFIGPDVKLSARSTILGPAYLGANARMFPGATISGPVYADKGAKIGNNALVRNSIIGEESEIGFSTEVARSYVGAHCALHTNYVGDSVLSEWVHMGSGAVTANLKLNFRNVGVPEWPITGKPKYIDTGRDKLGIMAGAHAQIGINASVMPGKRLGRNALVGAAVMLDHDLADNRSISLKWNTNGTAYLDESDVK